MCLAYTPVKGEIMPSTLQLIPFVVYLLVHGICLGKAVSRSLQSDPHSKSYSSAPWFLRHQGKLITIAFFCGPVGLLVYLLLYALMPQSQKTWLH